MRWCTTMLRYCFSMPVFVKYHAEVQAGCLKKGFDILCIDGCAACRRSRELCDGRNPCRNCDERHLVCEDEVSSPVARHEVVPPTMPPPVRTGERAKLACLACRRDNKKCGDQRPCARCISRSEECIHVNRGPKIVKSRCQACRDQNRKVRTSPF